MSFTRTRAAACGVWQAGPRGYLQRLAELQDVLLPRSRSLALRHTQRPARAVTSTCLGQAAGHQPRGHVTWHPARRGRGHGLRGRAAGWRIAAAK